MVHVLAEDGTAYRLVPEDRIAWHAGRSSWRGRETLNATSIGIEIVNLHGDRHDYPAAQIAAQQLKEPRPASGADVRAILAAAF